MTRWALGVAALVTAVTTLTGCGGSPSTADKSAPTPAPSSTSAAPTPAALIAYALVMFEDALGATDPSGTSHCDDRAGSHADVYTGAQIQLVDAAGKTVGSDTLKVASGADAPPKNVCAWTATFEHVPGGQGPYTAQVGSFRSEAMSESDLASKRLVVRAE